MRIAILLLSASALLLGCKNEPARDADPCATASANARRLATTAPEAVATYGADPLPVERCRTLSSKDEVACLAYASSWDELAGCSTTALTRDGDLARTR